MANLPNQLPFSGKPLRARIIISYILDYVILIALVVGFFILDKIEPYHQHFSLRNYTLQYPVAKNERIPMGFALVLTGAVPIVVIIFYTLIIDGLFSHSKPTSPSTGKVQILGKYRLKDRLWELNCGILGLLLSQAAAFVITSALKNAVGKPRPDFVERCNPKDDATDPQPFGLSNSTICRGGGHLLKDGFRSFPSGHSSSAFAGLFYLALYLAGKLHVLDSRGEVWKTMLTMFPMLGAALIAASRIMDARHHPFDVITGSMLGTLCAWAAYRQYFPPLSEPWKKGRAHPIRTWGTIPEGPQYTPRRFDIDADEPKRAAPLDEEYRGFTSGRPAPVERQPTDQSNPPENPFEPPRAYARRRHEDYSSSSGESNGAVEMQSSYGRRYGPGERSESTERLETRFPDDIAYLPPNQRLRSPSPPRAV